MIPVGVQRVQSEYVHQCVYTVRLYCTPSERSQLSRSQTDAIYNVARFVLFSLVQILECDFKNQQNVRLLQVFYSPAYLLNLLWLILIINGWNYDTGKMR